MFARFGLMALMISLAAGCDEEAKASTGDDSEWGTSATYDDSDVLARLDALEAAVDTMQEGVEANAAAIAAIDTSVLSYRLDEMEEQIDLLGGDVDLTAITEQIAANTDAISTLETDLGDRLTGIEGSGYITADDLPATSDLSGYLAAVEANTARIDSNTSSIEALEESGLATTLWVTAQHYGSADDIENNAATIAANSTQVATNTESIATNTAGVENNTVELAAITGSVDLTELSARVNEIEETYVTQEFFSGVIAEVNESLATITTTVNGNTESIASNAAEIAVVTGAVDLYDLAANVADLDIRVSAIDESYVTETILTATVEGINASLATVTTAIGENYASIASNLENIDFNAARIEGNIINIDTNKASIADMTATVGENYTNIAYLQMADDLFEGDIDTNKASIADMTATVGENYTNILYLQTADDLHDDEIDGLFLSIDDIDTIPGLSSYLTVDESTHTVQFSGANVQLINGGDWGATSEKNGLGNLIIGYNEELMVWGDPLGWVAEDERSGSHNLVVGGHHSFTGSSGIVSGDANRLYASYTAAIGGNEILCTEGACVEWLYADGLTLEAAPTW